MSLWRRVLAERKRLVVPLLIALAINVAVLALGVFPLQASVARDEERALAVKTELAAAKRLERLANDTRTSQARADQELKKFYSDVLPRNHSEAVSLLYLELRKISRQTGLTFADSKYDPEAVDNSSLMRFRVDVTLTGDYSSIRQFLYELESAEEFFIVESVRLGSSGRQGAGSLQLVVTVTTYYMGAPR